MQTGLDDQKTIRRLAVFQNSNHKRDAGVGHYGPRSLEDRRELLRLFRREDAHLSLYFFLWGVVEGGIFGVGEGEEVKWLGAHIFSLTQALHAQHGAVRLAWA